MEKQLKDIADNNQYLNESNSSGYSNMEEATQKTENVSSGNSFGVAQIVRVKIFVLLILVTGYFAFTYFIAEFLNDTISSSTDRTSMWFIIIQIIVLTLILLFNGMLNRNQSKREDNKTT